MKRNSALKDITGASNNWSLYSCAFTGFLFIVVASLEGTVVSLFLSFLNSTLSYQASGSSFIIIIYFSLFILIVGMQLLGAIEASITSNTMQVVALSLLNIWNFVYSLIQILQLNSFKSCVDSLTGILATVSIQNLQQSATNSSSIQILKSNILDLQTRCFFSLIESKTDVLPVITDLLNLQKDIGSNRGKLDRATEIQIAICIFMFFGSLIGCYLSFQLYQQLGWSSFHLYTKGDLKKKRLLERFQFFLLIIKINAFLFIGICLQLVGVHYIDRKAHESIDIVQKDAYIELSVYFILIALYFVGGILGAKSFKPVAFKSIFCVSLGLLGYLIFLITQIRTAYFRATLIWTFGFICLSIVSNIISICFSWYLLREIPALSQLQESFSATSPGSGENRLSRMSSSAPRFSID